MAITLTKKKMKKNINKIFGGLVLASVLVVGCKDALEEIKDINYSRVFSPTNLDARVVNLTSARLAWSEVKGAETYDVELSTNDFASAATLVVNNITIDQVPLVIPNLDGETEYTVRVKAKGTGITDSKWISAKFKTAAEQIFQAVQAEDLKAKEVILRWPAGQVADKIVLNPGETTHTVTAAEVAAGAATITGLSPETTYTARLERAGRTRGTVTFTTLLDLDGAIAVSPTDDLAAIIANAKAGDVFALLSGTYNLQDVAITKSISIKGAKPADKPVIKGAVFRLDGGAGLSLKDLILDGTGSLDGSQTFIYAAGTFAPLLIEDSEIKNYTKGLVYVNTAALIESVIFTGNIIHEIECNGGDFIDFRNGNTNKLNFLNNTVYNSALARDFFRMDAGGSTNFPNVKAVLTVSNNTFYNIINGNNRRFLYVRLTSQEITVTKNIFANTEGYYSNQAITNVLSYSKNNYFSAPNFTASTQSNAKNDASGTHTSLNPNFTNAASGNFKVGNDDLKFEGIGDPRWLK